MAAEASAFLKNDSPHNTFMDTLVFQGKSTEGIREGLKSRYVRQYNIHEPGWLAGKKNSINAVSDSVQIRQKEPEFCLC